MKDTATNRSLRIPLASLLPEGTEMAKSAFDYAPPMGSVVTVHGTRQIDPSIYYVVIKPRGDSASLARLGGGDGDRYSPKVPTRWLKPVPYDESTRTL